MKFFITIVILVAIYLVGNALKKEVVKKQTDERKAELGLGSDGLPGMDGQLEGSLKTAEAQGPAALKSWIGEHYNQLHDPKLGDIQLDYAMMIIRSDPDEAKRIFQSVKARISQSSPIYPRIKKLEPTLGS